MGELPLQRDRVGPHFEAGPIVTPNSVAFGRHRRTRAGQLEPSTESAWTRLPALVMFKIPLCCGTRSRHKQKSLYQPSRRSLAKAAGQAAKPEEIITLTFVRKRDEHGGLPGDTGLKLLTDADGMYVQSVRPGSVGAPDGKEGGHRLRPAGAPEASLNARSCLRLHSAPDSLGRPASRFGRASRPHRACFRLRRVDWAFAGRWAHCGQRAAVCRRAAGGDDDHELHVVHAQGEAGLA